MSSGEYYIGPEPAARVLKLTDELEQLLERYLQTIPEEDAEEALAEFVTPRSDRIDDLLRRVELDGERHEPSELARSLREHFCAVESGVHPAVGASSEASKWRKRTASDIHRMVGADVRDRVSSYVHRVANEDEATHAFDSADDSTLKGVPPANSPPIGLATKKYRSRSR